MAESTERTPLLHVEHLCKEFPVESGVFASRFNKKPVSAVQDVSFGIYPGETFGLVGESGCGKSTTGRCIMRLTHPTSGTVVFDGKDVSKMNKKELKEMRRNMQFIFQDPYASLNPRMTIGEIISDLSMSVVGYVSDFTASLPGLFIKIILLIISTFFITIDYDKLAGFIFRQLSPKAKASFVEV